MLNTSNTRHNPKTTSTHTKTHNNKKPTAQDTPQTINKQKEKKNKKGNTNRHTPQTKQQQSQAHNTTQHIDTNRQ